MSTSEIQGQCNLCGWQGKFLNPNGDREGLHCGNCGSSSRSRAVVYVLGTLYGVQGQPLFSWPARREVSILESSARGMMPLMLHDKFDYRPTEYDADRIAAGDDRYADFQDLSMGEGSFDIVIASDVFEHVRRDRKAFAEVFRVLKPGGTFLLTVPYDHTRAETLVRVDTSGETDVHLMEPEYHGGGGHTLTYRHYGRDLLSALKNTGFAVVHHVIEIPQFGITHQSVFTARRDDFGEVVHRAAPTGTLPSLGPLPSQRLFLFLKFNLAAGAAFLRDAFRKIKG